MLKASRAFLYVVGVLILLGGLAAFIHPPLVTEKLFLAPTQIAGTAEIRGLYGGGFISFGVTTLLGLRCSRLAPGLFIAMAIFMWCVAAARVISVMLDHEVAFTVPSLIAEIILGAAYWIASEWKRETGKVAAQ
ncbi:MAG: DUF4345 family protein [Steroidobacteraceae bacterium]